MKRRSKPKHSWVYGFFGCIILGAWFIIYKYLHRTAETFDSTSINYEESEFLTLRRQLVVLENRISSIEDQLKQRASLEVPKVEEHKKGDKRIDKERLDFGSIVYNSHPWPSREELKVETEQPGQLKKRVNIKNKMVDFNLITYKPEYDIWISAIIQRGSVVYEPDMIANLYNPDMEKKGVLEVGANIGTLCTPVAKLLGNEGRVIAIEANPENFKIASSNGLINGIENLWLLNYAVVKDSSAHTEIQFKCDPQNRGHCSLLEETKGESLEMSESWMKVPTLTIDDLYKAYPKEMCEMGVMKVDVEGYEGHVILGAGHFLDVCPVQKIYLELNSDWLADAGTPVDDVLALLAERKYTSTRKISGFGNYEFRHCSITPKNPC